MRYQLSDGSTNGYRWWSVIEYDGDKCKGGDAHWVCKELAEAAKELYQEGTLEHGERHTQDVKDLIHRRAKRNGWSGHRPLTTAVWS